MTADRFLKKLQDQTTRQHFYHVGSTEDLRHAMTEALVTNLSGTRYAAAKPESEQLAFFESIRETR